MSKRTNKAGLAARFGPRYGVSVRRNAASAIRKAKASYRCPQCHYQKVRRQTIGIWSCGKCDHTFAGGAWEPYTRASVANMRVIRRNAEGATSADMAFLAQQRATAFAQEMQDAAASDDDLTEESADDVSESDDA